MTTLPASAFSVLSDCYLREAKTVTGYTVHDASEPGGPKLDVHWVWTADANGAHHA